MRYGSLPMRGNSTAPKSSTGTRPANSREVQLGPLRVARQVGDDEQRLVAVLADEGEDAAVARVQEAQGPRPKAGCRLRRAMMRFVHHSSDCGFACWAATFTAS